MPMADNFGQEGTEMDLPATHQRLLVGAALRTEGPILELGCGWYSTPILHEIAVTQKRLLITVDNLPLWLETFKATDWRKNEPRRSPSYGLECEYHRLRVIGCWADILELVDDVPRFGLVFVDNGQESMREIVIRALRDRADVFVLHDTEEHHAYGYHRTLPLFRHKWEDISQVAETTVASDTVDVSRWFRYEVPRVIPTKKEIT